MIFLLYILEWSNIYKLGEIKSRKKVRRKNKVSELELKNGLRKKPRFGFEKKEKKNLENELKKKLGLSSSI